MSKEIRIVAVGDVLMWGSQIAAARTKSGYDFDSMFASVRPLLKAGDITIGNLETTLSGREQVYQQRNPKTGYPKFNCPDELAGTLKRAGFHVMTTANNHCMDRGVNGLKRTLSVLDRHGLKHTGTFRSAADRNKPLIVTKNDIRVGILSYTYGTNFIPVPKDQSWLVNRISLPLMKADIRRLRDAADVVVVCVHFGNEFHRKPNNRQRQIASALLNCGADIVFGAHPHVIQPLSVRTVDSRKRVVCYSLGNFISARMMKNPHTQSGVIVTVTVRKDDNGGTSIGRVSYVPTWTARVVRRGRGSFKVYPVSRTLKQPPTELTASDLAEMKKERRDTLFYLSSN